MSTLLLFPGAGAGRDQTTLVNAHTTQTAAGRRLVLVAPSSTVVRILALSGLAGHFTVEPERSGQDG